MLQRAKEHLDTPYAYDKLAAFAQQVVLVHDNVHVHCSMTWLHRSYRWILDPWHLAIWLKESR